MNKGFTLFIVIAILLFPTSIQLVSSEDELLWRNENWSFKQEIQIPIDTGNDKAIYQPIDISFEFDDICWAKNESEHSVRVILEESDTKSELESQIYNLNFSDQDQIKSCNIVFLIPKEASGNEKYYVYYDESPKPNPNYPDYVDIQDSYYLYEPIPGYPFESNYFKIIQDEFIIYAIAQGGKFMGTGIAQQITKLKPKSTDVMPKSGELFASFDFMYYFGEELDDFSGSIDNLISKEIFVNGNLMVSCGIISESSKKDIRTSVVYKYYYCPIEDKRINAHVKHETLKEFTVATEPEVEGSYASFQCGGLKSNSIKDLNFGEIYPFLHIYSEEEKIVEYKLDPDPEDSSGPGKWQNVMVVTAEDDIDLGKNPWISYDEGESGLAHALILGTNSVLKSGTNERDGVQIKVREQDSSDLPGLESDMVFVQFGRNSYEIGEDRDLDVPDDLVVEYDAEFFSTPTGGYKSVEHEANLFQLLVKNRPIHTSGISGDETNKKKFSLTTFIHLTSSVPFGSSLSIVTGRNLSFISAELYKNGELYSTGICERLTTNPLPNFENVQILQKIILALGIFDWKNLSLFKKIRFENLEPGKYLVKIYKENPIFGKEKKYIGLKIIEVDSNTISRIFCSSERLVEISVYDQFDNGIEGAEIFLLKNNISIAKGLTYNNGKFQLKAPCNMLDSYDLKIVFQGFIIFEDRIKFKYLRKIYPIKKTIDIEQYDLTVNVVDTWGLSPDCELRTTLTSNEMEEPLVLTGIKISASSFLFSNLIPATYHLKLTYKSFSIEKTITISPGRNHEIDTIFESEFNIKLNIFDSRGFPIKNGKIGIERRGEKREEKIGKNGTIQFLLPPGYYKTQVIHNDKQIGKRTIKINGDRSFDFITTEEPFFPIIIIFSSIILSLIGIVVSIRKKDGMFFVKLLAIALVFLSLAFPWWILHGSSSNSNVETTSKLFLLPSELVTITSSSDVVAGEIASLPGLFVNVIFLIPFVLTIGCVFVFINMVLITYKKRFSTISLFLGFLSLTGTIFIVYYALSELTKVGVGSFIGEGYVDVSILGEGIRTSLLSSWGPGIGFYLCCIAIILILLTFCVRIKKSWTELSQKKAKLIDKKILINYFKKVMPLVGIIILIYLIINIGTDKIITTFLKISPIYFLIAAVLTLPRVLIRNVAWQRILKLQEIKLSYFESLKIFLIGYFYGSVTPGYLGQLMRIPYMKEKTAQPFGKLFVNNIVETAIHTLSLYCLMIIGAVLIVEYVPEALPFAIIFFIVTIIIYWFFIKKERGEKTFHLLIKFLIPKKLKHYFFKFADTFYTDFPNVTKLVVPFLLGIPTWIIIYSQIYILGLSIDLGVPYFVFLSLYPIANLIAFIPITASGLGTREATLIFLFSFFGVSPEKAVVVSLAGHLLTDVLTGFYGFVISLYESRIKNKDLSELEKIFKKS